MQRRRRWVHYERFVFQLVYVNILFRSDPTTSCRKCRYTRFSEVLASCNGGDSEVFLEYIIYSLRFCRRKFGLKIIITIRRRTPMLPTPQLSSIMKRKLILYYEILLSIDIAENCWLNHRVVKLLLSSGWKELTGNIFYLIATIDLQFKNSLRDEEEWWIGHMLTRNAWPTTKRVNSKIYWYGIMIFRIYFQNFVPATYKVVVPNAMILYGGLIDFSKMAFDDFRDMETENQAST